MTRPILPNELAQVGNALIEVLHAFFGTGADSERGVDRNFLSPNILAAIETLDDVFDCVISRDIGKVRFNSNMWLREDKAKPYSSLIKDARMLVFIAGPFVSNDDIGANVKAAVDIGLNLHERGYAVYIPHISILSTCVSPHSREYWLAYQRRILEHCNVVYRLPGDSEGSDQEEKYARSLKIPVVSNVDQLEELRSAYEKDQEKGE